MPDPIRQQRGRAAQKKFAQQRDRRFLDQRSQQLRAELSKQLRAEGLYTEEEIRERVEGTYGNYHGGKEMRYADVATRKMSATWLREQGDRATDRRVELDIHAQPTRSSPKEQSMIGRAS
jgi:hypothetical protein